MACKVYRKSELKEGAKYEGDPTGRELVLEELKLLAEVDHPNIVKI